MLGGGGEKGIASVKRLKTEKPFGRKNRGNNKVILEVIRKVDAFLEKKQEREKNIRETVFVFW